MQKYFSVVRVHVLFSADRIRPYISGWQGGSNYINAVYVDVSNDSVRYNKIALDMCKCCTNSNNCKGQFLPCPLVKEEGCNFESCVWRAVSCDASLLKKFFSGAAQPDKFRNPIQ